MGIMSSGMPTRLMVKSLMSLYVTISHQNKIQEYIVYFTIFCKFSTKNMWDLVQKHKHMWFSWVMRGKLVVLGDCATPPYPPAVLALLGNIVQLMSELCGGFTDLLIR